MAQDVSVEAIGAGVIEIRLERPERMNALGAATGPAIEAAMAEARRLRARVVVLRGRGRAFCAGADLKERRAMDAEGRLAHNASINAAVAAVARAACVTIAAINGAALGGGLELALACDLRFAAAGATMGLPETRIGGIPAAGGTQRLPRLVGVGAALEMMLTGEPIAGRRAREIGLVSDVWPDEAFEDRVRQTAVSIASRSAPAMAAIKRLVREGLTRPLADGLALERAALPGLFASADYAEGLAAFAERRPPVFADEPPDE